MKKPAAKNPISGGRPNGRTAKPNTKAAPIAKTSKIMPASHRRYSCRLSTPKANFVMHRLFMQSWARASMTSMPDVSWSWKISSMKPLLQFLKLRLSCRKNWFSSHSNVIGPVRTPYLGQAD
jgi:hypothetical protein